VSRAGLVSAVLVLCVAGGAAAIVLADSGGGQDGEPAASATGRWTAKRPSLLARTEVAVARVGRFVYVMGGFERRSGRSTAAVERYDLRRDRWRRVADMPAGLNHAAAVSYRGSVYAVGGYRGRRTLDDEVATLYRYQPRRDRWTRLAPMPTARGALAAAVVGHRLYAVGGAATGRGALATLEVYDFRTGRWAAGPDLPLAREHLAAAAARGHVYALAGRAAGQGNFARVDRYDPARRRWARVRDMARPRGGIAAATIGNRIAVFGGEEADGTIGEVELYDPARNRWRALPGMRTPRHGLGGVSAGNRIYAIEGGDEPGFHFTRALESLLLR
jgi:N-acetylneuraminic acid mutarotase